MNNILFLSYKCITFKLKLLYCQTNDRPELIYSEYTLKACKFYKCLYSSYVFFLSTVMYHLISQKVSRENISSGVIYSEICYRYICAASWKTQYHTCFRR